MILDKFGGAVEARSEAAATAKSKAKPGQRRPAASEVECAA